ncbi:MAG: dihydrofolate reductase [Cyclobacteriaceae bacterium]|nr:dihydrofolate reductase [Cyclobacteriaceae bacterium]
MEIAMIAAVAENGVIGKDNDLVWSLPDDMKYFMNTTKGHYIILGRKNFESLPPKYRPLPNRTNVVVTHQKNLQLEGAHMVNTLEEAFEFCRNSDQGKVFVIGGGQIYKHSMPFADTLYITEIHQSFDGDTFFPEFDKNEWQEVSREQHGTDERHLYPFDFVVYKRK